MATKVYALPHSTSHSPISSPHSSRTHTFHASSASQETPPNSLSVKRKSWQTSDATYLAQGWADPALTSWEAVPSEDWNPSGAATADVTQVTVHRTLAPNPATNIGHEDHLHPHAFEDGSHKYSPASSARNSVQSVPVTTPSLMGSMDSSNDHIGGTAEGPHDASYQYNPPPQNIPRPSQSASTYPQLTIQTSHLPQPLQPQSPSGAYGPHYSHNVRSGYPPSRDYRYSYEPQLSYTSPTMAGPPQALFSPVLQHPHGVNHHEYFHRSQNQPFYPEYVTSPTTAAPPSMYFAAPPQPMTWNAPITPSMAHIQPPVNAVGGFKRQNNQGQTALFNHHLQFQSPIGPAHHPISPTGAATTHFILPPSKLPSHLPSRSVPLPARGRHSAATRVPSTATSGQQGTHAIGRHNRREQCDSAPPHRSSLLEDFRSNRNKRWELQDIQGHVVEFSGDQHGSRFIQHKLVAAQETTRSMVYREIIPSSVLILAHDVFGNYVLQKLCELGTPDERATIARTLQGHLVSLALDMYGCRVLQRMIDYLGGEEQSRWIAEFTGHILQCVKDANGNHVVQKFLESPLSPHSVFVNTFRNHVYELATHPYGCRVLQRCFEHVEPDLVRPLLTEMHQRTLNLMQDQYGNYVMQFILEKGAPLDRNLVIQMLKGHMLPMSKHKFASNVCEKAILNASLDQRMILIKEISLPRPDGMNPMITMIKDQYANYVLQRALEVAEGEALDGLLKGLRPQILNMRRYAANSPFTKHIIAVEKILQDRNIDINTKESNSGSNSDSTTTPTMQAHPPGV